MTLFHSIKYQVHICYGNGFRCIMLIENLRIIFRKGRSIWKTHEERKEIVDYCINHNRDYKGTASIYNVSYSQVYSWVKKYDVQGDDGLTDRRGRHKTDEEVNELERLRRENIRLKRQLQEKDMLNELLKKVQELERMSGSGNFAMIQNL